MTLAAIGWTVVQSLWQWTLVAGVAAWIFGLLRTRGAHVRYMVGCAVLVAMVLIALVSVVMTAQTVDTPFRFRVLYAFDGALIMPEVSARGRTILEIVGGIWLVGVAVGLVRVVLGARRVRQLRRTAIAEVDRDLRQAISGLRDRLGIAREVTVHQSQLAAVPMVLGWRRPQVLLPPQSADLLTAAQRFAIVAHELGHVRRGDVAANAIQVLIDVVAFYHPAARWVSARIRAEREYACDDVAVAVTNDARGYARALAALEDARSECRLVVAAASGTLLERIQRLVGQHRPRLGPLRGALSCAIATIVAAVIFALIANVPPPWVPAGVRLRRPLPPVSGFKSSPHEGHNGYEGHEGRNL